MKYSKIKRAALAVLVSGISVILAQSAVAQTPSVGDTIALKSANGNYVTANNGSYWGTNNWTDLSLVGNYFKPGDDYAKFLIENAGGGRVALKCLGSGKYVSVDNSSRYVTADSNNVGTWESFDLVESAAVSGKIGFRSAGNSNFIIAKSAGNNPLRADNSSIGAYGSFAWEVLTAPSTPPYNFTGGISNSFKPNVIGHAAATNLTSREHMWNSAGAIHYAEYYTANAALRFSGASLDTSLLNDLYDRYYNPSRVWEDGSTIPLSMLDDHSHFMGSVGSDPSRIAKHRSTFILLETYKNTGNSVYYNKARERSQETWDKMAEESYPDIYHASPNADAMFQNPFTEAEYFFIADGDVSEQALSVDRTARWLNAHIPILQRDDGLYMHHPIDVEGITSDEIWGRGAGWCHMALAEGLMIIPENHEFYDKIYRSYLKNMDAMLRYQQSDGMWYQLIDLVNHPDNWKESSGTAMIGHSFVRGVDMGWLDANVYGPAITDAWLAVASRVDGNGEMDDTCRGLAEPRLDEGLPYYFDSNKNNKGDFHGQCMILWFASELIETEGGVGGSAPDAPANLNATATSSSAVSLTWGDRSNNEDEFRLQRRVSGGTFATIATLPANTTSYDDSGLAASTSYDYRVRAQNAYGNSSNSAMKTATTLSGGGGGGFNQTDDFNSGYGNWNDGGSDCNRVASGPVNGSGSIRLRDNSGGTTSTVYTDSLDLSDYYSVTLEFTYRVEDFEGTEDFMLQVSTNGGGTFSTVKEWNHGTQFENDEIKSESVVIDTLSSSTVIRFRCSASDNSDLVYLDDITISTP